MTAGAGGLWGLRTNLFRQGQCAATTDYTASVGTTVAVDGSVRLPPFTSRSIKVVTDGLSVQQGVFIASATGQNATAGTLGVGSLLFVGVAGASYLCALRWRNGDATTTQGTSVPVTASGFPQLVGPTLAALAVAAGKTGDRLELRLFVNGTRAESFWVGCGMLEKNVGQISPYIPTSGATASRQGGRRWQQENERRMMHRYAQVWP